MAGSFKNLAGPSALRNNPGGTVQYFYWAPISYFTALSVQKDLSDATVTDEKNYVNITADHTFASGKGFHKVYVTRDTGTFKIDAGGERDGRSFKATLETTYPDMNDSMMAMITMAKNERCIVLAVLADGMKFQMGSDAFPAELNPSVDSQKNESGLRGTKLVWTSFLPQGPTIYTGAVVVSGT